MWAFLANLFSGGAIGAVTGLFGVAVQRYFDLKNATVQMQKSAQDNAHELAMKQMDIDQMKAEADSKFAVSELDAQSVISAQDAEIRKAAYALEPQTYSDKTRVNGFFSNAFAMLDIIRGLVRPGLTVFFAVAFMIIFWECIGILKAEHVSISPDDAYDLIQSCVNLVITLFATCTTFYFGTRNQQSEAKARGK